MSTQFPFNDLGVSGNLLPFFTHIPQVCWKRAMLMQGHPSSVNAWQYPGYKFYTATNTKHRVQEEGKRECSRSNLHTVTAIETSHPYKL